MVQHVVHMGFCNKWAADINIDPSCIRIMDPNIASKTAWAELSPWPQVIEQASQIGMSPLEAWSQGTNITTCDGPDLGHPHSFLSELEPQKLVDTLAVLDPQTNTWPWQQKGLKGTRVQDDSMGKQAMPLI